MGLKSILITAGWALGAGAAVIDPGANVGSDLSVAIAEFFVAAFRALQAHHGKDIFLPVNGFFSSYRNIRLGLLPKPNFAKQAHGLEWIVAVLKGVMYYMSYAPEGFTERTIDVNVPAPVGPVNMVGLDCFTGRTS
ncbi:MAG: hypothetical protein L6R41_002997 [Letrouitia leprolyta]|nr:MAG: hypothetical protein L6R41_002997 [Letrouitia leprolyta]